MIERGKKPMRLWQLQCVQCMNSCSYQYKPAANIINPIPLSLGIKHDENKRRVCMSTGEQKSMAEILRQIGLEYAAA
jgi:hypothetical protein